MAALIRPNTNGRNDALSNATVALLDSQDAGLGMLSNGAGMAALPARDLNELATVLGRSGRGVLEARLPRLGEQLE